MTPWNQVTIIGVGLIGGSLGLALKAGGLARRVVGVGHRQASLDDARRSGAADETTLDPAAGVRESDLVVLATPVGLFPEILSRIAPALAPGAVVIDVGSTKVRVVADMEERVPEGCSCVGCHPIAGSEHRGVAFARADLLRGAVCVVTPTRRSPPDALRRVVETWEGVGMTVRTLSPQEHDRLLAEVSHLPHVVAAALVRAASAEAEPLVGPGWADTTRIAGGDPALWRDILMSNSGEVAAALERFQGMLAAFRSTLRQGDAARIEALLAESKSRRDRLKQAQVNPGWPPNFAGASAVIPGRPPNLLGAQESLQEPK
ncbi:MAG: prephenate dehydrogenase [Planctomycetes bacterium]|nr:prephenate dehydrogenase [Planctomycetota bacterium]